MPGFLEDTPQKELVNEPVHQGFCKFLRTKYHTCFFIDAQSVKEGEKLILGCHVFRYGESCAVGRGFQMNDFGSKTTGSRA